MPLLTDQLRDELPPIFAQEADDDPIVYARFFLPDSAWEFYATEGEPEGTDFRLAGYVTGEVQAWRQVLASELEAMRGPEGGAVERDPAFQLGRFTDVVPAPEL
ncbi:MAG: DUF2958 domain-containing protein [Bryobacteraceae bacterium]